jgi:hypothetical protein
MNPTNVKVGEVYRVKPKKVEGIDYPALYEQGYFIDIRVLKKLTSMGMLEISTRDENGVTLGSCLEWNPEKDYLFAMDLEEIVDE